jgi:hypothetical protein
MANSTLAVRRGTMSIYRDNTGVIEDGRRHFVDCSKSYAALKSVPSANGRPRNSNPSGKPRLENPPGTVSGGKPRHVDSRRLLPSVARGNGVGTGRVDKRVETVIGHHFKNLCSQSFSRLKLQQEGVFGRQVPETIGHRFAPGLDQQRRFDNCLVSANGCFGKR